MAETDVLVLRPGPSARRLVFKIAAVISIVLVAAGINAGIKGGGRAALITGPGLALLLCGMSAVYLRRSRIIVTPTGISARGMTFHRRRDRALAASVLRATVVLQGTVSETIVISDAGGYPLLTINGAPYETADLDRLVSHLGLPTSSPDGPVTFAQLGRQQPGSVGWAGRHPIAFALLCALGFAVAALVFAIVFTALTN
ncbi:hypothetical protein ACFCV3_00135 [Kribbella sp. NPDC056345]|uniref:hypothetical protein n=1 Tax=Kribbella sp. NPDC056345 TaxID=3345789 RepID=UPI0035E2E612